MVFVGRITRQKGLPYFLRAAAQLPPDVQLVLCAGAPDTREIAAEVEQLVADLQATRSGVVWIDEMLPQPEVAALLSAGTVFACPSVYEPLGIVNLEAMACELAVVATATGGIPEVVVDGETGWLVPIEQLQDGTGTPVDPDAFVGDLAAALVESVSDPERARERGRAGRGRAQSDFSWSSIAARTVAVYEQVLAGQGLSRPRAGAVRRRFERCVHGRHDGMTGHDVEPAQGLLALGRLPGVDRAAVVAARELDDGSDPPGQIEHLGRARWRARRHAGRHRSVPDPVQAGRGITGPVDRVQPLEVVAGLGQRREQRLPALAQVGVTGDVGERADRRTRARSPTWRCREARRPRPGARAG